MNECQIDNHEWVLEIWAWANEFGLNSNDVPRDGKRLLALKKLNFLEGCYLFAKCHW